jgi:hypothetical protein
MDKNKRDSLIIVLVFFAFMIPGLVLTNVFILISGLVVTGGVIIFLHSRRDPKTRIDEVNKYVKKRLRENATKETIRKEIAKKFENKYAADVLTDYPEPALKKKYSSLNWVLVALLIIFTTYKAAAFVNFFHGVDWNIASAIRLPLFLLFISVWNIYAIYGVWGSKAYGYFWAIIILAIALFAQAKLFIESFSTLAAVEIIIVLATIVLAKILFKRIHPDFKLYKK